MAERIPLVLLAGLLCDENVWQDVAAQLEEVAQPSIFSFPGYSTIESMAEAVLARAPPRFAIAGHSMGGRVAIEVARRAPERLLGIALLNTGTHPPRRTRQRLEDGWCSSPAPRECERSPMHGCHRFGRPSNANSRASTSLLATAIVNPQAVPPAPPKAPSPLHPGPI